MHFLCKRLFCIVNSAKRKYSFLGTKFAFFGCKRLFCSVNSIKANSRFYELNLYFLCKRLFGTGSVNSIKPE